MKVGSNLTKSVTYFALKVDFIWQNSGYGIALYHELSVRCAIAARQSSAA